MQFQGKTFFYGVKLLRLGLMLTSKDYSKTMTASFECFNSCQVIITQFRGICQLFYFLYFHILTWRPIKIYDKFWERQKGRIFNSYLICANLIHFFLLLFDFLETSHRRFLHVFSYIKLEHWEEMAWYDCSNIFILDFKNICTNFGCSHHASY